MKEGKQELWNWFGLSYASFLTIPRVLMHQMSDEWQSEMCRLLQEYDETFLTCINKILVLQYRLKKMVNSLNHRNGLSIIVIQILK